MARFTHIPIVNTSPDVATVSIRFLDRVSVAHEPPPANPETWAWIPTGTLFGIVSRDGSSIVVELFADETLAGDPIYTGTIDLAEIGKPFPLKIGTEDRGQAVVKTFTGADDATAEFLVVVSFASDSDVQADRNSVSTYPGWNANDGLSGFHANAVTRIVTSILPNVAPGAFPTSTSKPNPFVPISAALLPDLLALQSPGTLKELQAAMVKAASWQQAEHTDEGADLAAAARERVATLTVELREANNPTSGEPVVNNDVISFGSFDRDG